MYVLVTFIFFITLIYYFAKPKKEIYYKKIKIIFLYKYNVIYSKLIIKYISSIFNDSQPSI